MDRKRRYFLERAGDHDATLTKEEMAEGWHWCMDWDLMLVGPDTPDAQQSCYCFPKESK